MQATDTMMVQERRNPRHHVISENCKTILAYHDFSLNCLSEEDVWRKLHEGVFLDYGWKRFFLDAQDRICFELFARTLSITWGSSPEYWIYRKEQITCGEYVDVAELLDVCWLDIQGHFDTGKLSPDTEYEVLFDIKMKHCAKGWQCPVKFSLKAPNGCLIDSEQKLDSLIGLGWKEISIGRFRTQGQIGMSGRNVGFKMYEHGGFWKSGLIVRSVIIRPIKFIC